MLAYFFLKKQYLIPVGAILLLLICYKFAFHQTIEAWKLNRQLTKEMEKSVALTGQPDVLGRTNANLNLLLKKFKVDTANFRGLVINNVSAVAQRENAKVTSLPSEDAMQVNTRIVMQKVVIDGSFFSLLNIYHELESNQTTGLIRSVSIATKKRINESAETGWPLSMTLYIAALKKN